MNDNQFYPIEFLQLHRSRQVVQPADAGATQKRVVIMVQHVCGA